MAPDPSHFLLDTVSDAGLTVVAASTFDPV
jgi:hypothetical protein